MVLGLGMTSRLRLSRIGSMVNPRLIVPVLARNSHVFRNIGLSGSGRTVTQMLWAMVSCLGMTSRLRLSRIGSMVHPRLIVLGVLCLKRSS